MKAPLLVCIASLILSLAGSARAAPVVIEQINGGSRRVDLKREVRGWTLANISIAAGGWVSSATWLRDRRLKDGRVERVERKLDYIHASRTLKSKKLSDAALLTSLSPHDANKASALVGVHEKTWRGTGKRWTETVRHRSFSFDSDQPTARYRTQRTYTRTKKGYRVRERHNDFVHPSANWVTKENLTLGTMGRWIEESTRTNRDGTRRDTTVTHRDGKSETVTVENGGKGRVSRVVKPMHGLLVTLNDAWGDGFRQTSQRPQAIKRDGRAHALATQRSIHDVYQSLRQIRAAHSRTLPRLRVRARR